MTGSRRNIPRGLLQRNHPKISGTSVCCLSCDMTVNVDHHGRYDFTTYSFILFSSTWISIYSTVDSCFRNLVVLLPDSFLYGAIKIEKLQKILCVEEGEGKGNSSEYVTVSLGRLGDLSTSIACLYKRKLDRYIIHLKTSN